jgi:4-amino-4-deoxy-L-arabinose transferase
MKDNPTSGLGKAYIGVFLLFLLPYVVLLGKRELFVPDETRYGEIPREMIASGNWVVPHLNGLRYFEKPVLGYWLNAISIELFGENAFAVRLPSALSTALAAALIILLLRKSVENRFVPALGAAIFLTCAEVFAVGVFSVLDADFSLFVTGTMVAFFLGYSEVSVRKRTAYLVLAGISCGLAFLTKGFLAFALPVGVIVPFLMWERQWRRILTLPWIPLVAAVLVTLPWAVLVHLRDHDFWKYFFWTEHVKRFFDPVGKSQHPEAWWFMIPVLLLGAIPWTFLCPAAVSGLRRSGPAARSLVRFALCWLAFPFLLFSASRGKLGTYILPCFAPLGVLMAIGLASYLDSGRRKAFNGAAIGSAVLGAVGCVVLIVSHIYPIHGLKLFEATEFGKWELAVAVSVLWAVISLCSALSTNGGAKMVLYCAVPAVFFIFAHLLVPQSVYNDRAPCEFIRKYSLNVRSSDILVSSPKLAPAICWTYKRTDVRLLESGGEFTFGLDYDDARHRLLTFENFASMASAARGTGSLVIVVDTGIYLKWKQQLPQPVYEDIGAGFVFARF